VPSAYALAPGRCYTDGATSSAGTTGSSQGVDASDRQGATTARAPTVDYQRALRLMRLEESRNETPVSHGQWPKSSGGAGRARRQTVPPRAWRLRCFHGIAAPSGTGPLGVRIRHGKRNP
jgi:hypothetical protein